MKCDICGKLRADNLVTIYDSGKTVVCCNACFEKEFSHMDIEWEEN